MPNDVRELTELNDLVQKGIQEGKYLEILPSAERAAQLESDEVIQRIRAFHQLGNVRRELAQFTDVEECYLRALQLLQSTPERDHAAYATTLNDFALYYEEIARYSQSEKVYRQALQVRQEKLGETHPDTAQSLTDLGILLTFQFRFEEAKELIEQALQIRSQNPGKQSAEYARTLHAQSYLNSYLGHSETAEKALQESISIRRNTIGESHPDFANSLLTLSYLRMLSGQFEEATRHLDTAEEIIEKCRGREHPRIGHCYEGRARIENANGNQEKAAEHSDYAIEIYRKSYGENHPTYADSLLTKAVILPWQNLFSEAEELARESLRKTMQVLGDKHLGNAHHMTELAGILNVQNKMEEAENLLRDALKLTCEKLGNWHPEISHIRSELAMVLLNKGEPTEAYRLGRQIIDDSKAYYPAKAMELFRANGLAIRILIGCGKAEEAIVCCEEAIQIGTHLFGAEHAGVVSITDQLAVVYSMLGRDQEALNLLNESRTRVERRVGTGHIDYAQATVRLAAFHHERFNWDAAEPFYQEALELYRRQGGERQPVYADTLIHLARLFHDMGNFTAADVRYRRALEIRESLYGENHLDVAASLHMLGSLHHQAGNFREADQYYQRALEIRRLMTEGSKEVAQSLLVLGMLRQDGSDLEGAESYFTEAMQILESVCEPDHPEYIHAKHQQANFFQQTNRFEEAEKLLREVIESRRKNKIISPLALITALNDLANLLASVGDYVEAENLLQEVQSIIERQYPNNPVLKMGVLQRLARLDLWLGEPEVAAPKAEQALILAQTIHINEHPELADTMLLMGDVRRAQRSYDDAEALYRKALQIRRAVFGKSHLAVADTLLALGWLCELKQDKREAETIFQEYLETVQAVTGKNHPMYLRGLMELAEFYFAIGNFTESEKWQQQRIDQTIRTFGESHPFVSITLNRLGDMLRVRGIHDRAESVFRRCIEILETNITPDSARGLAAAWNALGLIQLAQSQLDDAETSFQKAIDLDKEYIGENHLDHLTTLRGIAEIWVRQNRLKEARQLMEKITSAQLPYLNYINTLPNDLQRSFFAEQIEEDMHRYVQLVRHTFSDHPESVRHAADLCFQRKHLVWDVLLGERTKRLEAKNPKYREDIQRFRRLRRQIGMRMFVGPGAEGMGRHETILREWQARANTLHDRLIEQIPDWHEIGFPDSDTERLASIMPDGAVLVDVLHLTGGPFTAQNSKGNNLFTPRYVFFYLPAKQAEEVRLIDLGEERRVEADLAKERWNIEHDSWRKAKQIIWSLDGAWVQAGVPCLPDTMEARLPSDLHLRFLGTARDLIPRPRTSKKTGESVVMGCPNLGEPVEEKSSFLGRLFGWGSTTTKRNVRRAPRTIWPTLAPSILEMLGKENNSVSQEADREEIKALASLLKVVPFFDTDACWDRLSARARPRFLHLATRFFHFKMTEEIKREEDSNPLPFSSNSSFRRWESPLVRCGLLLSESSDQDAKQWTQDSPDGFLTLLKLLELDLEGTRCITLSIPQGEGKGIGTGRSLIGLQRTLYHLGVESAVVNVQSLSAKVRREFYTYLYRELVKDAPFTQAIQESIRQMVQTSEDNTWRSFLWFG